VYTAQNWRAAQVPAHFYLSRMGKTMLSYEFIGSPSLLSL